MPQLNEFCSQCGNNWMGCECNDYHPPFKLPDHLTVVRKEDINTFSISRDEAIELQDYFLKCGYISHEFHMEVHAFIRKLDNFLKTTENVLRFKK